MALIDDLGAKFGEHHGIALRLDDAARDHQGFERVYRLFGINPRLRRPVPEQPRTVGGAEVASMGKRDGAKGLLEQRAAAFSLIRRQTWLTEQAKHNQGKNREKSRYPLIERRQSLHCENPSSNHPPPITLLRPGIAFLWTSSPGHGFQGTSPDRAKALTGAAVSAIMVSSIQG